VKSVKNVRYVEKTSAECDEDLHLAILHLSRVELHCKLQEKLHRVTWP
jgi:signal transduction histidine kinase